MLSEEVRSRLRMCGQKQTDLDLDLIGQLESEHQSLRKFVLLAFLEATAAELFEVVRSGAVKIMVNQTYALKDAAEAHRALEGRKTTGSTVLLPG